MAAHFFPSNLIFFTSFVATKADILKHFVNSSVLQGDIKLVKEQELVSGLRKSENTLEKNSEKM